MTGGVRGQHLVAEAQHLLLVGHVAGVAGDHGAARRIGPGQVRRLRDRVLVHVAGRDRAARGRELPDQFASDP